MKKIILTIAAALVCLTASAFANFSNTSLVGFSYNNIYDAPLMVDTIISSCDGNFHLAQQLYCVAFYDIDHLVIANDTKKYIRIENSKGDIITETHDSIDIVLEPGNYYVYSSTKNLVAKYRN